MTHFKLTSEEIKLNNITLYRIELTKKCKWGNIGDKGGFVEKKSNLNGDAWVSGDAWVFGNAQVSDNAQVSGNAWVSGNAQVSAKASFKKGWFIGGDDSGKITDITEKTGSTYWKNQYVLGDYEIEPIEEVKEVSLTGKEVTVTLDGKTYTAVIK